MSARLADSMLNSSTVVELVIFTLDDHRCALPLASVDRLVRAVAVTPLPDAPAHVWGVIEIAGTVIPVFNLRRRFRLTQRPIGAADQFIIARTSRRQLALAVDHVQGVFTLPQHAMVGMAAIHSPLESVHAIVSLDDGVALIQDIEEFLSRDDEAALELALRARTR